DHLALGADRLRVVLDRLEFAALDTASSGVEAARRRGKRGGSFRPHRGEREQEQGGAGTEQSANKSSHRENLGEGGAGGIQEGTPLTRICLTRRGDASDCTIEMTKAGQGSLERRHRPATQRSIGAA